MMIRVHGYSEAKALVKEAIQNGSIYDFEGVQFVTHGGFAVAHLSILKSGAVLLNDGKTSEQIGSI